MAITFVAAGTAFTRVASGTTFTLNKPAGVADGDIMIASVCFDTDSGSLQTVTPPSGWTSVRTAWGAASGRECQVTVLAREATASEPSSWEGTIASSVILTTAAVSAYRGVQSVLAHNASAVGVATSFSTATVNNTVSGSWRLTTAAYAASNENYTISASETIRRILFEADDEGDDGVIQAAIWDSNTPVLTGNNSRTISRSSSWSTAASVILLLEPSTGTPATGDLAWACSPLTVTASGEVHDDATMEIQLGSATQAFDGLGQPIPATGTATVQLGGVVEDFAGLTAVSGSLDTVLPSVTVNVVAETRVFGVRVITVESDDRSIVVPSRGGG